MIQKEQSAEMRTIIILDTMFPSVSMILLVIITMVIDNAIAKSNARLLSTALSVLVASLW